MQYQKILLASHNSTGSKAAESAAMSVAKQSRATIEHLVVVPDLWKGMMGDDWLNNANTQKEYGSYVEGELQRELQQHSEQLEQQMIEAGIDYSCQVHTGNPEKVLSQVIEEGDYDLVVMGSRRPKGIDGLRSRMLTERLHHQQQCPVMIIPHPQQAGG